MLTASLATSSNKIHRWCKESFGSNYYCHWIADWGTGSPVILLYLHTIAGTLLPWDPFIAQFEVDVRRLPETIPKVT